ncbi:hypothetical protein HOG16_03520 [Candidatus Woesearchaeota archaeon]|jgi:hypothetical protein|nr:hypothetical protein [Candidatus Woesearchaeota archaeon]MBT4321594.1 hypothetical protein [Candidatus Woesearchaeota archaeon]MBT4631095.1 hypothetical protein [Candidatus Woesearchaeota archaeon]
MGLINFFKKKKKVEEVEEEIKKIPFDELENFLNKKRSEIKEKEKEIFSLIENKTPEFIEELNKKIITLENKGNSLKNTEDKIYLIVKENLGYYILRISRLLEDINNKKEDNFEEFVEKTNKIFLDFNDKTHVMYQKVTLLIGDEIANIKSHINNFSKYQTDLFDENKEIIDSSKAISSIKLDLIRYNETKDTIDNVNKKIELLDSKIKKVEESDKSVLNEIEEIKKSESYIENLKKQEEIKLSEDELENESYKLKDMVDFKALGNIFHTNEEKMNIVKSHKEDFQTNFQKSNGEDILKLLNEAKLDSAAISVKMEQIADEKEKININKETIKENETGVLFSQLDDTKLQINNLNDEKTKEQKKYERFEANKEVIMTSIKNEAIKLNLVIG